MKLTEQELDAAIDAYDRTNCSTDRGRFNKELCIQAAFDAVAALRAQADVRPVGTLEVLDRSKYGYLPKIVYTHGAQKLPDGRYDLYTHRPEASAPGLSDDEIERIAHKHGTGGLSAHWPEKMAFARDIERAILTRASAATVAEGWQLVPVKPTEQMQIAGRYATHDNAWEQARAIWGAMLAAAPTQQGGLGHAHPRRHHQGHQERQRRAQRSKAPLRQTKHRIC